MSRASEIKTILLQIESDIALEEHFQAGVLFGTPEYREHGKKLSEMRRRLKRFQKSLEKLTS